MRRVFDDAPPREGAAGASSRRTCCPTRLRTRPVGQDRSGGGNPACGVGPGPDRLFTKTAQSLRKALRKPIRVGSPEMCAHPVVPRSGKEYVAGGYVARSGELATTACHFRMGTDGCGRTNLACRISVDCAGARTAECSGAHSQRELRSVAARSGGSPTPRGPGLLRSPVLPLRRPLCVSPLLHGGAHDPSGNLRAACPCPGDG